MVKLTNIPHTEDQIIEYEISVANAAAYPPNWTTLKSSAAGQKTVGRVTKKYATFYLSACGSSFFFEFESFLSIQRVY